MNFAQVKLEKCKKCGGKSSGFGFERTVFYLTDEIKVRCNNCGDVETFQKHKAATSRRRKAK